MNALSEIAGVVPGGKELSRAASVLSVVTDPKYEGIRDTAVRYAKDALSPSETTVKHDTAEVAQDK